MASPTPSETLDKLFPIPAPAEIQLAPPPKPGMTVESQKTLVKLLKDNHEHHHIFFNDRGFHKYVHQTDYSITSHCYSSIRLVTLRTTFMPYILLALHLRYLKPHMRRTSSINVRLSIHLAKLPRQTGKITLEMKSKLYKFSFE